MSILEADGLVKIYGRRRVVDGVSLSVNQGEIVGLLGPNGAGKTTSFKMMCGIVTPNRGRVFLQGKDVTKWPMYLRAREGGMGYLPQKSSVFAKLNCEQNLKGMMQLLGFSWRQQKTRCEELLEQFKITHIRKSKAGDLSGGERRRLEIARCLVSNPRIIMLDEPFAGIDPVTVQNIRVVIKELSQQGIAVLITDHDARAILQSADRTYVVSEGRILVSGSAEEIVRNEEVRKKYLGDIELPDAVGVSGNASSVPAASTETLQMESRTANASVRVGPETVGGSHSKITFSKPRSRKIKKVVAPFRSTDLD